MLALYSCWILAALCLFRFVRRDVAIWIVIFGGWLLLPPGNYVDPGDPRVLPYWIVGGALPSDILFVKAWTAPAIATLCSLIFDRGRWRELRFVPIDIPILLFCGWPLGQALFTGPADPAGLASAAYLAGVWGLPWLIAKLYLRDLNDAVRFAGALAYLSLALVPVAVIEGVTSWRLHSALLGVHPFTFDGMTRYVGFRPQGLFEHGNQYGIWCAGATLAACWRLREEWGGKGRLRWSVVATVLCLMTLMSQSVGAIILLAACGAILIVPGIPNLAKIILPLGIAASLGLGALHISGAMPLRSLADRTVAGQAAQDAFRALGRQSLPWRIGQDLKTIPIIQENWIVGHARWDWFEPAHSRPWGLPLLLLGQFGLVGFACLTASLIAAVFRHMTRAALGSAPERLFATLLLLFAGDALLNSFLFYPAILAAGAAAATRHGQQSLTTARASQTPRPERSA